MSTGLAKDKKSGSAGLLVLLKHPKMLEKPDGLFFLGVPKKK